MEKPVKDFLDSLDKKMRAKAVYSLSVLEEFGNALREPYSKPMGGGLFELRIKFASDISRIFYFFVMDNKIILTNGFIKQDNEDTESRNRAGKEVQSGLWEEVFPQ